MALRTSLKSWVEVILIADARVEYYAGRAEPRARS